MDYNLFQNGWEGDEERGRGGVDREATILDKINGTSGLALPPFQ